MERPRSLRTRIVAQDVANYAIKETIKEFAKEAKNLDRTPSKEAVQRTITRVLNDVQHVTKSTPVKKRLSILRRLGRLLKSAAYRSALLAAITGGAVMDLGAFGLFLYAIFSSNVQNPELYVAGSAVLSLLGNISLYMGTTRGIRQLRENLAPKQKIKIVRNNNIDY